MKSADNGRVDRANTGRTMKKYVCDVCGWVYNPAEGDPDNGVPPRTLFEAIPAEWVCPVCGVGKDSFSPVDELS